MGKTKSTVLPPLVPSHELKKDIIKAEGRIEPSDNISALPQKSAHSAAR